jgi:hypothetical protein
MSTDHLTILFWIIVWIALIVGLIRAFGKTKT